LFPIKHHSSFRLVTYSGAINFLYGLRWFGMKPGLSNTLKLASLAGNPHHHLRFIHVAGTNGKGSTCAMLESIYRAAGLRVGLFTSPHLVAFGERIQVNRQVMGETEVVRLVDEMRELVESGWGRLEQGMLPVSMESAATEPRPRDPGSSRPATHPTFFEVVTVMALRHFLEEKCDLVIWETGLGGRLDSTNIVTPLASVITNIQHDHQQWLGNTLASIAAEKAGIIKPGVPVITAEDQPEALAVIEQTAGLQNSPLTRVTEVETYRPPLDSLKLPLLGRHQRLNAAVAVATVRTLAERIRVTEDQIRTGLSGVQWPGRLQLLTRLSGQRILLDGAHNVGGATILAEALQEHFPGPKPALILGVLQDKDWPAICQILAPLADRILLAPVSSGRSAAPEDLAAACRQANPAAKIVACASFADALTQVADEMFVVITGSLYLVGEALESLGEAPGGSGIERSLNEWSAKPCSSC
jgi:dihydrofolate synthase/folylpolyglutamate synthase